MQMVIRVVSLCLHTFSDTKDKLGASRVLELMSHGVEWRASCTFWPNPWINERHPPDQAR